MKNVLVSDIMTRSPVTINKNADLLECAKKMINKKVGSLLLVDKKKFSGLISQKDILWALIKKSKKELPKIKACEISPKKIIVLNPSTKIEEAIKKIKKFRFYRYPVVKDDELVGMITIKDILSFYPSSYYELKELEFIREEKEKLKRFRGIFGGRKETDFCEQCGKKDYLEKIGEDLICEDCRNSM